MKRNDSNKKSFSSFVTLFVALALACALVFTAVAENTAAGVPGDTNPAIAVTQKNLNSVVGIITNTQSWSRQTGETTETKVAEGSGVVIADGYVLTNYHVIEDGSSFQVVLPGGDLENAQVAGTDPSTDLAVLKVNSDKLVPVSIGSSSDLLVGSTVIAIGNPGGQVLANTVTEGIVSALERTSMNTNNTTREISYIQHDAAINSGNSGGGLFDANGNLIGINTLKYFGSVYTGTYEGLGFAIPVDTAYPIAMDLIQYGKVRRPQMGVTVATWEGPDEPMSNYAPASACVYEVTAGSPAEQAGIKQYDFITEVNGTRVKSLQELTTQLDAYKEGDSVEITLVRYANPQVLGVGSQQDGSNQNDQQGSDYLSPYDFFFGRGFGFGYGYGNGNGNSTNVSSSWETIKVNVTLKVLDD